MPAPLPPSAPLRPCVETSPEISPRLFRSGHAAFGRSYRGEIWEFVASAPMGKGHGNANKPFDISSANYLRPVLRAMRDPMVRKIVIRAAVKTMKTFAVECGIAYHCAHGDGDIGFYLADLEAAKDHAKSRFWDWFWAIPELARMRLTVPDRFDDTTRAVYFPGKTLRVWPLNESATQGINLCMVVLSDAFLAGKTGLISQMIARTTQYKPVRKILIESQGGIEDDDFDIEWKDTNQGAIYVVCPLCGAGQPFEWDKERPQDFTARIPHAKIRELIAEAHRRRAELSPANPTEASPAKPTPAHAHPRFGLVAQISASLRLCVEQLSEALRGKFAGMKRGDETLIKLPDGDYNENEVLRQTHYECYHCGGAWQDDGEFGPTRVALDESAYYVPARTTALPENLGFSWPQWANRRLRWGDIMLEYLKAKRLQVTRGNTEKLKQWYQKVAGRTWDPRLARDLRARARDVYDVAMARHNAWRLVMIVDNQLDLAQQWVMVLAVQKNGAARQIWRGPLLGLAECRKKQLEYGTDAKGGPLLKDQFVFLDARYKPEQICRHIVEHKYGHWSTYQGERTWLAWNLLQGNRYEYQTHAKDRDKSKKFVVGDPKWREFQLDNAYVEVLIYPFSATACGERFEADRDGHGVETLFLDRQPGEPPDDHELSHFSQIYSNKLMESESFEPRAARKVYVPVPKTAPDHYFHMWRMFEAIKEIWGIDGVETTKEKP